MMMMMMCSWSRNLKGVMLWSRTIAHMLVMKNPRFLEEKSSCWNMLTTNNAWKPLPSSEFPKNEWFHFCKQKCRPDWNLLQTSDSYRRLIACPMFFVGSWRRLMKLITFRLTVIFNCPFWIGQSAEQKYPEEKESPLLDMNCQWMPTVRIIVALGGICFKGFLTNQSDG